MPITPVALIADGREIARFGSGSYEFPWFTAPMQGLVKKHQDWLADVSQFHAEVDAASDDDTVDEAAEEALWHRRLAELRLAEGDLDIFSRLSVVFSDGSIHRIDPTYFEDGDLRWRNGEKQAGKAAEFERPLTHTAAFLDFCKGIFEQLVIHMFVIALLIVGLVAWSAGWFG